MIKHKRHSSAAAPADPAKIGGPDWNEVHLPVPGYPVLVAVAKRYLNKAGPELGMQNYPAEAYGLFVPASVYQNSGDAGGGQSYVEFGFDLDLPPPPDGFVWACFATGSVYYQGGTTAPGEYSWPAVGFEASPSSAWMSVVFTSTTTDEARLDMSVYAYLTAL